MRASIVSIIQALSDLSVFSISFSALCSGNQNQSTTLPDDSVQLLILNIYPPYMLSQVITHVSNCLP